MVSLDFVKEDFVKWLDRFNSKIHPVMIQYKGFLPPDEKCGVYRDGQKDLPNEHIPYPIQQVEEEIFGLLSVLVEQCPNLDKALEIGMGDFGGTHRLFKYIFGEVYTVEIYDFLIEAFKKNNGVDDKSHFILTENFNYSIISSLPKDFPFLFIDGDHSLKGVMLDYLNYKDLVIPGGLICFHDTKSNKHEVSQFVSVLAGGQVDGKKHEIHNIWHSEEVGISYMIKD